MNKALVFQFSIHPLAKELGARMPDKKHTGDLLTADAGWDVYAVDLSGQDPKWPSFPRTLQPGEAMAVPTGLTFVAPRGWFPEVVAKTGRALQGVVPAAIVYDWQYRPDAGDPAGSVFSVRNVSDLPVELRCDKAFAQLILRPLCPAEAQEVAHGTIDTQTERGDKRYGGADGEGGTNILDQHLTKS